VPLQKGNRCFQAQQYKAAADAYTQALALQADDASLNAVLLCNRAAALHSCGQHLEAIADCCLAEQLDPHSTRALQVRLDARVLGWVGLTAEGSSPAEHSD
jgi:tetratricopeptide (TPR) repeat protein